MTAPVSEPGPPAGSGTRTGTGLDRRAVGAGAVATTVMTAVPIAALRVAVGSEGRGAERNLWVVAVVALFLGFAVGGFGAAKRRPDAPYRHAAASGAVAYAALFAFTLARRLLAGQGVSFPLLATLAVFLQVTVSFALLGGYVAWRQAGWTGKRTS